MSLLSRLLGIDAMVERAVDKRIEQVRQVTAAITGEEYVPKYIACDKGKHFWERWREQDGKGVTWSRKGFDGKDVRVRGSSVFCRSCKACGERETKTIVTDLTGGGDKPRFQ